MERTDFFFLLRIFCPPVFCHLPIICTFAFDALFKLYHSKTYSFVAVREQVTVRSCQMQSIARSNESLFNSNSLLNQIVDNHFKWRSRSILKHFSFLYSALEYYRPAGSHSEGAAELLVEVIVVVKFTSVAPSGQKGSRTLKKWGACFLYNASYQCDHSRRKVNVRVYGWGSFADSLKKVYWNNTRCYFNTLAGISIAQSGSSVFSLGHGQMF